MPFGVAVSNGTAALEIAVKALGLEPGDEVILPSFTIISCALAIIEAGAVPVLVDCDPDTWCMDVSQIEAKVTARTRAIMPVHMYGHPVEMNAIESIAGRHELDVIEDAAEAHGAEYHGRRVGAFGRMSCFSFYANKIITTGEGGMVLCRSEQDAQRARTLRNLCFRPERRFWHTELGHNYRLTNIQAAIGCAQVSAIDEHLRRKRRMASLYSERLAGIESLQLPTERADCKNVFWMYGIVLNDDVPFDAAEFALRLSREGIETRPFFLGMHEQPVLRDRGLFAGEEYPVTERIARRGLYLPSGLALTEEQMEFVCDGVARVFR